MKVEEYVIYDDGARPIAISDGERSEALRLARWTARSLNAAVRVVWRNPTPSERGAREWTVFPSGVASVLR